MMELSAIREGASVRSLAATSAAYSASVSSAYPPGWRQFTCCTCHP